jgi:hypothetical protein
MEGLRRIEVDDLPPALRRRIVGRRDRYERGIRSIIAAGIKSREFTPADPKLGTRAILGSLNWTVRWYRPDGPQTPSQVGAAFAAYLVRGLIRTPARASRNGRRAA